MEDYDKRMKKEQTKRLPVGTIIIAETGAKYENVYIEIPKNSCWLHFYNPETGLAHTIPSLQVEDIEWKERWK